MEEAHSATRFTERAFSLYQLDTNPDVDYLRHPSGVIVLQLRAGHECLSKSIVSVSFETSKKKHGRRDHTKQTVTGKGKRGALQLQEDTKLCIIACSDDSAYTIRAGIKATLIEVNARLVDSPQLLKTSRAYGGYLGIVLPSASSGRARLPKVFGEPVRVGTELHFEELADADAEEATAAASQDDGETAEAAE